MIPELVFTISGIPNVIEKLYGFNLTQHLSSLFVVRAARLGFVQERIAL